MTSKTKGALMFILIAGGILLGFYGFITRDYGTVHASNVKTVIAVIGAVMAGVGFIWLIIGGGGKDK